MPLKFAACIYGMTELVIDATEFKFEFPTNYDLDIFHILRIHKQENRPFDLPYMVWESILLHLFRFDILQSRRSKMC